MICDTEIDCDGTDESVCPYCGYEETDSWEISFHANNTAETDCGQCGKTYKVTRDFSVSYSSQKLPEPVTVESGKEA